MVADKGQKQFALVDVKKAAGMKMVLTAGHKSTYLITKCATNLSVGMLRLKQLTLCHNSRETDQVTYF